MALVESETMYSKSLEDLCRDIVLSRTAEDYLKTMYILEKEYGRIRIKDIASRLGVKPSSVIEYLKKLAQEGFVDYKPGSKVKLTDLGRSRAKEIYRRHVVIKEFLMLIGVPPDIAEKDACQIEHGLHRETLERIIDFIKQCRGEVEVSKT